MKINKMKIASSMMTISTIAMATNVALAGHSKVPSKVFDAVSRILGGVSTVGIIVAAGMILYAGFKFFISIDEFLEVINLSGCYENENINYKKLNEFIYNKIKEQEVK